MRNSEHKRKQFIALLLAIILRFGEITRPVLAEGIDFVVDEDEYCYGTDNPTFNENLGYGTHIFDGELTVVDCIMGYATVSCLYCDQSIDREIDSQPHSLSKTEESSPTCTQDGLKPYWSCDVCHKTFSSDVSPENFECTLSDLVIKATGHKPGNPTPENVVDATCSEGGSYDLVTRCENCREILSSEHIETGINAESHTPGDPTPENQVDGTCSNAGSYDLVTRCRDCKAILASEHVTTDINTEKHTPGEPTPENQVDGTCSNAGSYDLVTRCKDCKAILASEHVTTGINADNHTPGELAAENLVESTCSNTGSYDLVTRCKGCKVILSSRHISMDTNAEKHTPDEPAVENPVEGTCSNAGSYDLVTRCKDCKEIISSQHIDTDINAENHTPDEPAVENPVDGTCSNAGSYDLVTRCRDCKEIISSEHIDTDINAENHDWGDWFVVSEAGGIRTLRRECTRDASHAEEKQEAIIVQARQEDPPPQEPPQNTQGQQDAGGKEGEGKTEGNANPQNPNGKVQKTDADLSGANAGESTVSMNDYVALLNDRNVLDKTQVFVSHIKTENTVLSGVSSSGAVVFGESLPVGVTSGSESVYQTSQREYDHQTGMTENLQSNGGTIGTVGEVFAGQSKIMDRTKEILFAGNMEALVENSAHTTVVAGDAAGVTLAGGNADAVVDLSGKTTIAGGNLAGDTLVGGGANSYEAVLNGTAENITITDGTGNNISKDAKGTVSVDEFYAANLSEENHKPSVGWKGDDSTTSVGVEEQKQVILIGSNEDGKDTLICGKGNDILFGDAGNDTIFGGAGDETLLGSAGNDTISLVLDNDSIQEGKGHTTISGDSGDHFYYYSGLEDVTVSADSPWKDSFSINLNESEDFPNIDSLHSGSGHNTFVGGSAKDTIIAGASGHNTLWGGAGSDILLRDPLEGSSNTFFYGGEGNDTVKAFSSADDEDLLYDFSAVNIAGSIDESSKVNLSTVSGGLLTVNLNDASVGFGSAHTSNSGAFGD